MKPEERAGRMVKGWLGLRSRISRDATHMKWKLFAYLAAFVCLLLSLLWIFQTVLLDDFYQAIKTMAVRNVAAEVVENIDITNLEEYLDALSKSRDMSILVADVEGTTVQYASQSRDSRIQMMTAGELRALYLKAEQAGGEWMTLSQLDMPVPMLSDKTGAAPGGAAVPGTLESGITVPGTEDSGVNDPAVIDPGAAAAKATDGKIDARMDGSDFDHRAFPPSSQSKKDILLARIATQADGSTALVVAYGYVVPVDSTIETLRIQLMVISVIFLLLSSVLALLLSKKLSTPITVINEAAKKLAKGDFETRFTGKGYREVTELSETLNYAARELSKVEGLRRELIANISHDLRTPLTMITGYAEVMRDLPGENSPENVQVIIEESRRLNTLVSDILDLSRLQSGVQELQIRSISLTQVVRGIQQRCHKFVEQDGLAVAFEADRDVCVEADEVRITQVIYNLVQNALAYTGQDKTVRIVQQVEGERVKISVIDTGPGIPADQLPYIWERYYKGDKAHRRSSVGTGLGLSIVKAVLERHHARYGVESSPMGSRFWFSLPLQSVCEDVV